MHPAAKVSEQMNSKCPLGIRFYNFWPLHGPHPLKLSISWTMDSDAIWRRH